MRKLAVLGACVLFGSAAAAFAEPAPAAPPVPAIFKPAQREGYFFVGGRYDVNPTASTFDYIATLGSHPRFACG